jgi:hypothetical protein
MFRSMHVCAYPLQQMHTDIESFCRDSLALVLVVGGVAGRVYGLGGRYVCVCMCACVCARAYGCPQTRHVRASERMHGTNIRRSGISRREAHGEILCEIMTVTDRL